jgi:hypothetical protein
VGAPGNLVEAVRSFLQGLTSRVLSPLPSRSMKRLPAQAVFPAESFQTGRSRAKTRSAV